MINDYVLDYKSRGLEPDYHVILRNSCFWVYFWDIMFCVFHAIISESSAVFYSYYVGDMIKFIRDKDAPYTQGIKVIAIFISA